MVMVKTNLDQAPDVVGGSGGVLAFQESAQLINLKFMCIFVYASSKNQLGFPK